MITNNRKYDWGTERGPFSYGIIDAKKEAHILGFREFDIRRELQKLLDEENGGEFFDGETNIYYLPSKIVCNGQDFPVTSIGEYAFMFGRENWGMLGYAIGIPDSVVSIQANAFACARVKKIVGCRNVKRMNKHAFDSEYIEYVDVPDKVSVLGKECFSSSNITFMKIPEKVKIISEGLFADCTKLKKVELPSSLREIKRAAFKNVGIEKIFIPYSVESISDYTFESRNRLDIYCERGEDFYSENIISPSINYKHSIMYNKVHCFDTFSFLESKSIFGDIL